MEARPNLLVRMMASDETVAEGDRRFDVDRQMNWLVEKMKRVADSTGVHDGMTLMFHIGRFSECNVMSKLWSTVCVADFLLHFGDSEYTHLHPMMSVFKARSQFDPNFRYSTIKCDMFRIDYEVMKREMERIPTVTINTYKTFRGWLKLAGKTLEVFGSACKALSKDKLTVTLSYICSHLSELHTLLDGVSKRSLLKFPLSKFVNARNLAAIRNGQLTQYKEVSYEEEGNEDGSIDRRSSEKEDSEEWDLSSEFDSLAGSKAPCSSDMENSEGDLSEDSKQSSSDVKNSESELSELSIANSEQSSSDMENSESELSEESIAKSEQSSSDTDNSESELSEESIANLEQSSSDMENSESELSEESIANTEQSSSDMENSESELSEELIPNSEQSSSDMENSESELSEESIANSEQSSSDMENSESELSEESIANLEQSTPEEEGESPRSGHDRSGIVAERPTKRIKRGEKGCTNTSGPRIQRVRSPGSSPNLEHFDEDNTITEPSEFALLPKPDAKNTSDTTSTVDPPFLPADDLAQCTLFDQKCREFKAPVSALPVIFVETFRNQAGEIVPGPVKVKGGRHYAIGGSYLNIRGDAELAEVLCCPTSNAYVYFFRDADHKPHFVVGREQAQAYRTKLRSLDIDLKVLSRRNLLHPTKILSDRSIMDGLRSGDCEESNFIFISSETQLFKNYYGTLNELPFPTMKWMEFFDKRPQCRDNDGRNFVFGHHDMGFGREGVAMSAHKAQEIGNTFVMGMPHMIGDREMMATIGCLVDRTTCLMDKLCFDNGTRLMNNVERDSLFGSRLRASTNSKLSRFEAYTVVRQPLGKAVAVHQGQVKFTTTARHRDGPNCRRPGYNTTGVFSYLCSWKGMIYRFSIIMYTRASVGNYCRRNFYARVLRRKLRDYIVERNGGRQYHDFSIGNSLTSLKGDCINTGARPHFFLEPHQHQLTNSFFERNPNSRWRAPAKSTRNATWIRFDFDQKYKTPLRIIVLPEFVCRYGFVSSFASQINKFIRYKNLETPKDFTYQLLYIALLSSSQVQYFYVVDQLMKRKRMLIRRYHDAKRATGGKIDVTLFRLYQSICQEFRSTMTAGPYPRVQAQPLSHKIFTDDESLRDNLSRISIVIDNIESGAYLSRDGLLTKRPGSELDVVGTVGSLSCAPLIVFTGMATAVHAINTAKQSLLNRNTRNSYFDKLVTCLARNDKGKESSQLLKNEGFLIRIFKSVAKSWNTVPGSIENGCCAAFRNAKKFDVFFRGQDLYLLDDSSNFVKVKQFGSDKWDELSL